ncbi:hypothetical protein BHM03_00015323 [Ensete ventricosum]|nr:hypothetical protein BHM03_00015323 [Ensete ventricosum]
MLIHQFITFGFACTPLYFVWEVVGMHDSKSIYRRAITRLHIWFLAIMFPFFGPISSAVGSLLNAAEKPPFFLPSWTPMYAVNAFVVGWVLVVGFELSGWVSMTNFIKQVDTFGLFAK